MSVCNQFVGDAFCDFGGDREAQPDIATGGGKNEVVHSDHASVNIKQRTAGVAGIDRGIGLHIIFMQIDTHAVSLFI